MSSTAVSRFGYIRASEIDIQNNTIKIYDITHKEVVDAKYISFDYLEIDRFYHISPDGSVAPEIIEKLSSYGTTYIPIVYITNGELFVYSDTAFDFFEYAESVDIDALTVLTARMVSENLINIPHSTRKIERLANISLGSIWCIGDEEEVLYIDDDTVLTTKNKYLLDDVNVGKVCVSVGDVLKRGDLITRFAHIPDKPYINDVRKIELFLGSHSVSESNRKFLQKISRAITKNTIPLYVDLDVLTSIPLSSLNAISEVFKHIAAAAIETSSIKAESETAECLISHTHLVQERCVCNIFSRGEWILETWGTTETVSLSDSGTTLIVSKAQASAGDTLLASTDNYAFDEDIVASEDSVNLHITNAEATGIETSDTSGSLQRNSFVDMLDESKILQVFHASGDLDDNYPFSNIIVNIADAIHLSENNKKVLSFYYQASASMEDSNKFIMENIFEVGTNEQLIKKLTVQIEDDIAGDLKASINQVERVAAALQSDTQAIHKFKTETASALDDYIPDGLMEYQVEGGIDDLRSNRFMVVGIVNITGEDDMKVIGDTDVDD
jgi:hypothetical protein